MGNENDVIYHTKQYPNHYGKNIINEIIDWFYMNENVIKNTWKKITLGTKKTNKTFNKIMIADSRFIIWLTLWNEDGRC